MYVNTSASQMFGCLTDGMRELSGVSLAPNFDGPETSVSVRCPILKERQPWLRTVRVRPRRLQHKFDTAVKQERRQGMAVKDPGEELWKRSYGPISDWKPAAPGSGEGRSVLGGAVEEVYKLRDSVARILEPLSEDAREKIKEVAHVVDDLAGRSSREARSLLAKTLETIAEKIKPN